MLREPYMMSVIESRLDAFKSSTVTTYTCPKEFKEYLLDILCVSYYYWQREYPVGAQDLVGLLLVYTFLCVQTSTSGSSFGTTGELTGISQMQVL